MIVRKHGSDVNFVSSEKFDEEHENCVREQVTSCAFLINGVLVGFAFFLLIGFSILLYALLN